MPYFIKNNTGQISRDMKPEKNTKPVTGFNPGISRNFGFPGGQPPGTSEASGNTRGFQETGPSVFPGYSRIFPEPKPGFLNFSLINKIALREFSALLSKWLPDGRLKGREWVARNPIRADKRPGSFCINVDTGKWSDFATGDRGGDVISLAAYLTGVSQGEAAKRLADYLGVRHD